MCGIAGYYAFEKERPTLEQVKAMMIEIEKRGTDAAGIGYLTPNKELVVAKKAVPAAKFIRTKAFTNLKKAMPKVMICHTRFKTKGEPTNEKNNHPIFIPTSAMVHNGQICNDDDVFDELGLPRQAEVDSEVLLRIFEKYQFDFKKAIPIISDNCGGSAAIAILHSEWGNRLMLARSNNPISLLFDKKREILFFGSTESTVEKGVDKPKKDGWRGFDISPPYPPVYSLNGDYAIMIGENGVEDSCDFKMPTYASQDKWVKKRQMTYKKANEERNRSNIYPIKGGPKAGMVWDTNLNMFMTPEQADDVYNATSMGVVRGSWVNGKWRHIGLKEHARRDAIGWNWDRFNNGIKYGTICGWCGMLKIVKNIPTAKTNDWRCRDCYIDKTLTDDSPTNSKLPENLGSKIECDRCDSKDYTLGEMSDWGDQETLCPLCYDDAHKTECCMCTHELVEGDKSLVSANPDEYMCLDCFMDTYNNNAQYKGI